MTIKVLIADDQRLVRAGVTQLIGTQPATGRTRWFYGYETGLVRPGDSQLP